MNAIKLGLGLPHAGPLATRDGIARAAIGAEEIGLDSVWVLDRVLRPLAPDWGEPPAPYYKTVFDPIETLSFVAGQTRRVQLGTSVIQALLHPPVILARRLATLDQLSQGRVIAGLGRGWMPEEFAIAGVPMSRRDHGLPDYLAAMRAVWGPDPVRYEGELYGIPDSDIGPKPAQPTGIPILIGYDSAVGIRLAARHGDGLHPNRRDLGVVRRDLDVFRTAAEDAGRDPATMPIVFRGAARLDGDADGERPLFSGTLSKLADDAYRLAELGVDHIFLQLHTPIDEQIETMAALRARLN